MPCCASRLTSPPDCDVITRMLRAKPTCLILIALLLCAGAVAVLHNHGDHEEAGQRDHLCPICSAQAQLATAKLFLVLLFLHFLTASPLAKTGQDRPLTSVPTFSWNVRAPPV